jgi:hypothetical protein
VIVTVVREVLDEQCTAAVAFADLHCIRRHLHLWQRFNILQAAWADNTKKQQEADLELTQKKDTEVQAEEDENHHAAEFEEMKHRHEMISARRFSSGHRKRPLRLEVPLYWQYK